MINHEEYQKLQKLRYNDKTWNDITIEDFHYHEKLIFRKIDNLFDPDIIEQSFKNKERFYYSHSSKNRDYSINGHLGEDGIYRAWFGAEFKGMGNGKYYLLLNPTTAVFMEDD